jgi:acetyl esterase/lipase
MMNRRSLLTAAASACVAGMAPAPLCAQAPRERLALWPGAPPGGGGPSGPPRQTERGALANVATPVLEVFAAARPNGAAALVAGGGGYKRIEMAHEAYPAAQWLADQGIAAFVLTYRLPREGWAAGPAAPLQDAQRALRLMRAQAGRRGLDPRRIGVMGFSAGGHLLGLAAARSSFSSYSALDAIDAGPARADFAALLYPVVTLKPPFDHTSTRRVLIGDHPSPEASAEWSVETYVRGDCPPMFLAQADDDPISDPANTRILEAACKSAGTPVELHRFAAGGHGFGLGRPDGPTKEWPDMCKNWMTRLAILR